tara:strand:+ start:872 stop:1594 length:723 start_codon:yes stop_codon:yes gene_type:complete
MIRIAMWSGPRNISTAMMRSWGSRSDTFVIDEPYYAYYLSQNDLDHPGREEVLKEGELDVKKISNGLANDTNGNCSIYYQKHITHHLLDSIDRDWMKSVVNCFLIRDPKDMIISYSRVHPDLTMHLLGLEEQNEIFEYVRNITGEIPPIIDAKDVLINPRDILSKLCNKIGVIFSEEMLTWARGSRETDGNWGKYWYKNVVNSTGFNQYKAKAEDVPPKYQNLYDECMSLYKNLHDLRIK